MKHWLAPAALIVGVGLGWLAAGHWSKSNPLEPPDDWVARFGDEYVTVDQFTEEMRRRGGHMPGQYQQLEQRRALLDELLYRRALVKAARDEGLDRRPEVRRALDQVLAGQYVEQTLRQAQRDIKVTDQEVLRHYQANASEFTVPPRRRVAMLRISVPPGSPDAAWDAATQRAEEALAKARALPAEVPHFGQLAQEFSDDQATRYRGGVIGWIAEGQAERYRYDPVVLEAAENLPQSGDVSRVLRGADAVYLVRLVEIDEARERGLEQLSAGIQQRLMRDRLDRAEAEFRSELLARHASQVRESRLLEIDPLSAPASNKPLQPPAMPAD